MPVLILLPSVPGAHQLIIVMALRGSRAAAKATVCLDGSEGVGLDRANVTYWCCRSWFDIGITGSDGCVAGLVSVVSDDALRMKYTLVGASINHVHQDDSAWE